MFKDKQVLIIGSGLSGMGAVKALCLAGANCIMYDGNTKLTKESVLDKMPDGATAEIIIGTLVKEAVQGVDLAVISPGISLESDIAYFLKAEAIEIIGELELGFLLAKGRTIAITGTNGKTTTTTLVGDIVKSYIARTFVVGNIGNPYTIEALKTTDESVCVAEVSSFQLETIKSFRPNVSAILNVTPDHLDRHHTMEEYTAVKERIANNQSKHDVCVLNYDNAYTRDFGEKRCLATPVFFSSSQVLEDGYFCVDDTVMYAHKGQCEPILNIHTDMTLVGKCNVENVMAAIAITRAFGIELEHILKVIKTFQAVEHRIEYVDTKSGVMYYNDSKATNPDAAIQGILAMSRDTILIGGGYDKHNTYDEWIEAFGDKVKLLVLIGQTKEAIAECAKAHGFTNYVFAQDFEECLEICKNHASYGDAVLLSPACASWGMFPNYEVRGNVFKAFVEKLK
ncbi:MAG: UDP-N-acetylmuramoyl-L-alanine--D-glutamate ligase [Lachnospiraceae bacterium]